MAFNLVFLFKFLFLFQPAASQPVPASIYDFKVPGYYGGTIDFSQFRGKKILIVNTPINADYSIQYRELEALQQKYKGKLVVVGFLSRDFAVPPGSKQEENPQGKQYGVTFPLAAKTETRGDSKAAIFAWLTDAKYNHYKNTEIRWDFQKYLINEQGVLVGEFEHMVRASDPALISAIDK